MADDDTLALILEELGAAFEPLEEALASDENFELYARELGWSVSAIPPALQALATPLHALAARLAAGSLNSSAVTEFSNLLRAVIEAVNRIQSAPAGDLPPVAGFAAEFPQQVLDRTIVDHLISGYPVLSGILRLLGVIEIEQVPAAPGRLSYTRRAVNWVAIGGAFQNPLATLDAAYDWSTAFEAERFIANLRFLLDSWGLFVSSGGLPDEVAQSLFAAVPDAGVNALVVKIAGDRYTNFGFSIGVYVAPTPNMPGLALVPFANGALGSRLDISEDLALTIQGETTFAGGFVVVLHPAQDLEFLRPEGGGPVELDTAVLFGIEIAPGEGGRRVLLGTAKGSRFEIGTASARAGGQFSSSHDPIVIAEVALQGGRIVIDLSGADGFLGKTLPTDGLALDFDLTVGVNSASGLYFGGSSGLEVLLPAHVGLGPVEIQGALLSLKLKDGAFVFEMGTTVSADLSVLKATVENVGMRANLRILNDGTGNAGPADLSFAFRPPNGVGLSINAGVVTGGGYLYLDPDKGEYAGALELTVSNFLALKAIGLINTKLPGGHPGFSLLVIVTAEFDPGVQLGFGFTLNGVGGLLGLNRRVLLEPLALGVRTGAVNNILFPTNVVANAPRIISDLRATFPPQEGVFLIGPMAKIGWGTPTLISISLGVIIEIPGNVVILGKLRVALPTEDAAVLVLQVSFIGALEFDKRRVWFFATLYESQVLFIALEGEMALLMDFGESPNFVLSVGGFHPRFTAPPLPFPSPNRVTLSLVNESWARVRVETYFAVTSNTVQTGARAEAFFGFSALSVEGYFSFDALLRFSPFYLIVEISAGFSVKVFGIGVFSIHLRASLEGPTPWHIAGSAKIKLLFFSISVDVDVTFGERRAETLPPIEVFPKLRAEFEKLESWRATPPASGQLFVSLRELEAAGTLVLHPVGTLLISERFAPLNLQLDKIGNQKPSDINKARVAVTAGALAVKGSTREKFAAAQYREMDDAAKLSAPAFEPLESGVELGAAGQSWATGPAAQRTVRYETIIVDTSHERLRARFFKFWDGLFAHFRAGASVARADVSLAHQRQLQPFDTAVIVTDDSYTVANQADNRAYAAEATFASHAEAQAHLNTLLIADPSLAESIHVIPAVEVNVAA